MKKKFLVISFLISIQFLHAQNVGIVILNPTNKLQVQESVVATKPITTAFNSPTPSQQIFNDPIVDVKYEGSSAPMFNIGNGASADIDKITGVFRALSDNR